jgi:hypothetical protein
MQMYENKGLFFLCRANGHRSSNSGGSSSKNMASGEFPKHSEKGAKNSSGSTPLCLPSFRYFSSYVSCRLTVDLDTFNFICIRRNQECTTPKPISTISSLVVLDPIFFIIHR